MSQILAVDVRAEARHWVVRLAEPDVGPADHRAFDEWLAGPAERGEAYKRALLAHSLAGDLKANFAEDLRASRTRPRRAPMWSAFAAATAIAASLVVAVLPIIPAAPVRPDVTTDVAEVREVVLPDGSMVTLGAAMALEVEFSARARRVKVGDGEAYFKVAHDAARPFFVGTRGATVRVVGTEFEVKSSEAAVRVTVSRGIVEVTERPKLASLDLRPTALRLVAGQEVVVDQASDRKPQIVMASDAPAPWRDGFLSYDDVPLSEVVADANRYSRTAVHLADVSLGDLRVTGSYPMGQLDQMLASLDAALPVDIQRQPDGSARLVPSSR
jgi:transmembrane sensor